MWADEPTSPSPGGSGSTPAAPETTSTGASEQQSGGAEAKPTANATPPGGDAKTEGAAKPDEAKTGETPAEKPKQRRGFAAMDRAKVRAIAMLGGAAVHRKGTAHRFSREEAREAGRKGGLAPHRVRGRKLPAEEPSTTKTPTEEG
jgi:general stress protein YciG